MARSKAWVTPCLAFLGPRRSAGLCFFAEFAYSWPPCLPRRMKRYYCKRVFFIPVTFGLIMILPVLQYPDPRLAGTARPIAEITPEIRVLAQNMVETMYARDGVGLAAPQVGAALRLVVIDISGPEKREDLRVLVNPALVLSGEQIDSEEGCLSVEGYSASVTRREKVHVEAQDIDGNPVSFDADGRLAVCCQHEHDHLDGILFIDHISRLKRTMLDRKVQKRSR